MNIKLIGKAKIIMSNSDSKHNYFGWPTVAKLKDGKIMAGASGFRLQHVCPFGKAVVSYSFDNGETYTPPAPVIDTPLDDRDAGICPFGEKGVIVTSFNNTADFQKDYNKDSEYVQRYLDTVTKEDEEKYLGANFRISYDNGITFGELIPSPVTSPHGPTELRDGTVLWVGNNFHNYEAGLEVVEINTKTGESEYVGIITSDEEGLVLAEAHLLELPDGKLICHARGEGGDRFTIYQSFSEDRGRTWTKPERLLDETGGAPPHLIMHSSGVLICTYGRRKPPYGIMAMVSTDCGKTWEKDLMLYESKFDEDDLGYPSTIELADGSMITVFYAPASEDSHCEIFQQKWRID